jgi:Na+(H+)/acetate symporter ActP
VLVPQLPEPDLGTAFLGTSILPFWSGLLVLVAAVVTFTRTGGAILLTVASAVSHDLYGALVAPGASAEAKVRVGRCAVVLFSAIPVVLALRQLALVNFVVIYAGKLLVSFLFVPVVIGLNWRRATAPGAIAAMLGGLSVCVGWSLLSPNYPLGIDPWEIATATSLVLFVLVSRATTPVRRDKLDVFFPAGDGDPRDGPRATAAGP